MLQGCYGLNVCPQKFICWNSHPPKVMVLLGGTFGRCLCNEGGALTKEVGVLIEGTHSAQAPSAMWEHLKEGPPWPHWQYSWSQNCEQYTSVVCKLSSLWCFITEQTNWLRQRYQVYLLLIQRLSRLSSCYLIGASHHIGWGLTPVIHSFLCRCQGPKPGVHVCHMSQTSNSLP